MIPLALSFFTSKLAGPLATVAAVILLGLAATQCAGRVKAERGQAKAEAQLVAAKRDLGTCRANVATMDAALGRQNAALAARSAEDAQRLADAGKRLSEAVKGREQAEAKAAKLIRTGPVGIDACARAMDAFETVKEQAR